MFRTRQTLSAAPSCACLLDRAPLPEGQPCHTTAPGCCANSFVAESLSFRAHRLALKSAALYSMHRCASPANSAPPQALFSATRSRACFYLATPPLSPPARPPRQGALQVFEGASLSGSSQRSSRVSFSQPPARAQERGRPRGGFFRASRSSVLGLPPFLCARPSSVKVQLHLQRTLDSQSVSL